jgi:hypothetical protein
MSAAVAAARAARERDLLEVIQERRQRLGDIVKCPTLSENVMKECGPSSEPLRQMAEGAAEFVVLSFDHGEDADDYDFGLSPEQVEHAMLAASKRSRVRKFFRTIPVLRLLTRTGRRNRAMRLQREKDACADAR